MRATIVKTLQAIHAQNVAFNNLTECKYSDIVNGTAFELIKEFEMASRKLEESASALAEMELMSFNTDGTLCSPSLSNASESSSR